jgi:hypothetical protein
VALSLQAADCRKLNILRKKLSKPCQYSSIAPLRNKFHWAHSGRNYFDRPSAPKLLEKSPPKYDDDFFAEDENHDEYSSGWRFLDVSRDADQERALEDNSKLKKIRQQLSKPCLYSAVAPIKNEFHWSHRCRCFFDRPSARHQAPAEPIWYAVVLRAAAFPILPTSPAAAAADASSSAIMLSTLNQESQAPETSPNEITPPFPNYFIHLHQHLLLRTENRLAEELRDETLRYIAQQLCVEAMERERRARVRECSDALLESPTCEAVEDELLLRADAKAAAVVARTWRATRVYSDVWTVPPVRPHWSACARNVFTTPQHNNHRASAVQCLPRGDLEATQEVLQLRADAKAFAEVAHAWRASRKYSALCPVAAPLRTHWSAFGRRSPQAARFVGRGLVEPGFSVRVPLRKSARRPGVCVVEHLAEMEAEEKLRLDTSRYAMARVAATSADRERAARVGALDRAQEIFGFADVASPTCEAVRDELLLRADAKAAAAVARTWRATRVYSEIKHKPDALRPHWSATARSAFRTMAAAAAAATAASVAGGGAVTRGMVVQCLPADEGGDLAAVREVLQVRADARAAAEVAHAWRATRKYSEINPVVDPLRPHWSAFGRNVFTTPQFMRGSLKIAQGREKGDNKEEEEETMDEEAWEEDGVSTPPPIQTRSNAIRFDPTAADKKQQAASAALGSPESIMAFPGDADEQQPPELRI